MGTYDYFVGTLGCSICGNISLEDDSTNMQTKIRKKPNLSLLGVGHELEVNQRDAEGAGYFTVNSPQAHEKITILDMWECPNCKYPYNWAKVIIQNNLIQTVAAVPSNRSSLEESNFVSDECLWYILGCLGLSYTQVDRIHLLATVLEMWQLPGTLKNKYLGQL